MPVVKLKQDGLEFLRENRRQAVTSTVQTRILSVVANVLPDAVDAKKVSIIGTFPDEYGFYPGGDGIVIRREE